MELKANASLDDLAARLDGLSHVLVTTHAKPDGDALGSMVAIAHALERKGKQVERWLVGPVPDNLAVLSQRAEINECRPGEHEPTGEVDGVVVVDTSSWSQLDAMKAFVEPRYNRTIVIDHHRIGDDVGAISYIDSDAAAACEIVADVIDELGVDYDDLIAEALFVGLASDTGWFRFSNTTPRTHELAARLQRAGVDHARLYGELEQAERPEKLALLIRALDSLKLVARGQVAVMTLRNEDFTETGALPEETERLVDVPQIVKTVEVVVLITEQAEGPTRVSFRSKPTPDAIDVSQLAHHFGGGGHARAAGAKIDKPVSQVASEVIEQIERMTG